jgi:hypothetical protein
MRYFVALFIFLFWQRNDY